MKKTHRNSKNHTKNAKNDISGITDLLPGVSPHWLSPITSFHHIGDNRYYRDILESVTSLTFKKRVPSRTYVGKRPRASASKAKSSVLFQLSGLENVLFNDFIDDELDLEDVSEQRASASLPDSVPIESGGRACCT
jgi:hypothetical protein